MVFNLKEKRAELRTNRKILSTGDILDLVEQQDKEFIE